jgi:hypothetical protein
LSRKRTALQPALLNRKSWCEEGRLLGWQEWLLELGMPMPVLTSRQNGVCLSVLLSSPKEVEVIT